ncbi:MAG: dihydroorotase [Propionibacteriaceae bacterium]|jgi:dihydroorotase|nr:dihydroorotase [Propionibacteriaceae bacterium]
MPDLLVRGVTLPDASVTDLGVRGGRFADPADLARPRVIDAAGLIALPGLVDLHTHLRQPGGEAAETVRSGTLAAARGGFTAVFAMPNTDPVTDTPARAAAVAALGRAEGSAEVVPVGAITVGQLGTTVADLAALHAELGLVFFSDDGRCVQDARVMRAAFRAAARFGGVLAQHSQDADLAGPTACCHESELSERFGLEPWPAVAESAIVARDVQLARDTGGRLHVCHVSTAESVEVIRWAKARGIHVTAEVTPHHLLLGTALLASGDTTFKVNPPLAGDEHIAAVRAGLADGTIDAVATDHAPHTAAAKAQPFPLAKPGMVGLEQALGVVIETMVTPGRLSWADVARVLSSAPARIGGLAHQGRAVAVGEPANVTLIDPSRRTRVQRDNTASLSRNNPYVGLDLPDPVRLTCWQGHVTHEDL